MRAAICYEFGQPLSVEEVEIDPPARGEIKVRVAACAICHSDIHVIRGEWGGDVPLVAGHEAAGVVEEVGEGVTLTRPGDRVVLSLLRSCGRCYFCTTGAPHLCEGTFALATERRVRNRHGQPLRQALTTGAFSDYTVVDESQVVRVPDDLPFDRAALLACGVITGVGAVVNRAKVRPGSSVVVIGTGGVGLNAIQGAVLSGAYPIIAIDLVDKKLAAARVFGATHTINAADADVASGVRAVTSGRGADYVFVTVGSAAAVSQGLELARVGGTITLVGMPPSKATAPLPIRSTVVREQTILGCSMGSTRLSVDVPPLVALYRQGRLKLDELITERYPLDQINDAIASVEGGDALRNVIVFG